MNRLPWLKSEADRTQFQKNFALPKVALNPFDDLLLFDGDKGNGSTSTRPEDIRIQEELGRLVA